MLTFKVIGRCMQDASQHQEEDVDFFLEEDYWNDYGYQTTYHLHAGRKLTKKRTEYLGVIHFMHKGQSNGFGLVEYNTFKNSVFHALDDKYCAMTWSLDLCRAVNQYLQTKELRQCFIDSLHLITSVNDAIYQNFKDEECFNKSFIRDAIIENVPLEQISQLLNGNVVYYALTKVPLSFTLKDGEKFGFDYSLQNTISEELPSDIIAFIGDNGVGKSTLLYNVAKVLYADADTRNRYDFLSVSPTDIGIDKLIIFSYSAFDNFSLPGLCVSDYRRIYSELDSDRGRFVFCGIRDVKAEYEELSKRDDESMEVINFVQREDSIRVKTLNDLADECVKGLCLLNNIGNDRNQHWIKVWKLIEDSMPQMAQQYEWIQNHDICLYNESEKSELRKKYLQCSTGIKFFMHCIISLLTKIDNGSVILFDEPENYLQPPLLSLLLRIIRSIAKMYDSVVMVATHSPIVIQETHARNVFIVNRVADNIKITHPTIETFGESFGFINNLVFHLSTDNVDYDKEIRLLYKTLNCKELSAEHAITRIAENMKATLSAQMVALVIQIKEEEQECGN